MQWAIFVEHLWATDSVYLMVVFFFKFSVVLFLCLHKPYLEKEPSTIQWIYTNLSQ